MILLIKDWTTELFRSDFDFKCIPSALFITIISTYIGIELNQFILLFHGMKISEIE